MGNIIGQKNDIEKAVAFGKGVAGIIGIVIIMDDRIALWGDISVVPLKR